MAWDVPTLLGQVQVPGHRMRGRTIQFLLLPRRICWYLAKAQMHLLSNPGILPPGIHLEDGFHIHKHKTSMQEVCYHDVIYNSKKWKQSKCLSREDLMEWPTCPSFQTEKSRILGAPSVPANCPLQSLSIGLLPGPIRCFRLCSEFPAPALTLRSSGSFGWEWCLELKI